MRNGDGENKAKLTRCLNTKLGDLHLKLSRNKTKMASFRLAVEHEIFYSNGQKAQINAPLFEGRRTRLVHYYLILCGTAVPPLVKRNSFQDVHFAFDTNGRALFAFS